MRTGVLIGALGLICAGLAAAPAQAQFDDDWRQRDNYDAGQVLPLDRILPEVRRSHPGRFYDAEGPFQSSDGQVHYRLKWMTPEGRVVWFDTNARTGRILGQGGGRHNFDNSGGPFDGQGPDERGGPDSRRQDEGRRNHFDEGEGGGPPKDDWMGGGPDRGWSNDRGHGSGDGHRRGPHLFGGRDHD
jgi:hypothetical protein